MDLWSLLNQVKGAIYNDPTTPHQPGHDPSGLIGQIESLFTRHAESQGTTIRPASEDPYGDPANADRGNYGYLGGSGMPAGSNVRPASEDPLGDPADAERR